MASLTNLDRTDRDLLIIIRKLADDNGITSSQDVANALDVQPLNGRSPGGRVSARLAWMVRLGQLERIDSKAVEGRGKETLWMITPHGEELLRGRVAVGVQRAIQEAGAGTRLLMMRELSQAGYVTAEDYQAAALRREWLHNLAQRRNGR